VKSKPIIANLRIARNYIEEAIEIPAMESTTSELTGLRTASVKKK
jgi:hypothetical protein